MSRLFDVEVNVTALAGLRDRLGQLSGERLAVAAADAVNIVANRFDAKQRAGQIADIALGRSYVDSKTKFWPASAADPRATITTKGDLTIMGRYPLSGLAAPGRRQAGVRAKIKPSAPVDEPKWFLMRLKHENGTGVFVRTSTGKAKHMYGPSPYSLFKHQIAVGEPALLDDLETTGAAALADAVEKALT